MQSARKMFGVYVRRRQLYTPARMTTQALPCLSSQITNAYTPDLTRLIRRGSLSVAADI